MTETTQRTDGAAVEAALERAKLHTAEYRPALGFEICSVCYQRYPCLEAVLAAEVERLREELEDAQETAHEDALNAEHFRGLHIEALNQAATYLHWLGELADRDEVNRRLREMRDTPAVAGGAS